MINAGAIMVCALLTKLGKSIDDILRFYESATSSSHVEIDTELYLDEKATGYSNHALTSLMLANKAFPKYDSHVDTKGKADQALDLYFKLCSILVNVESLSRFGAMLANDGVNPSSGERILKATHVQSVVTVMTTCGMYNGAGKFVKDIGIPSKSGVSGGLLSVVPGIGALVTFSPKLNPEGNSVKGIAMVQKLSALYMNFNLFHRNISKLDILQKPYQTCIKNEIAACSCASTGDFEALQRMEVLGVDLNKGDYDQRTPLHLAASNGNIDIVRYLLKKKVNPSPSDRWGATPLNDAGSCHEEIATLLRENGAQMGTDQKIYEASTLVVTEEQYRLFFAAANNCVSLMKSLLITQNVNYYDYDRRTALGIASSEGNLESVKYLLNQGAHIHHIDSRGNDALADAKRERREEVINYLERFIQQGENG